MVRGAWSVTAGVMLLGCAAATAGCGEGSDPLTIGEPEAGAPATLSLLVSGNVSGMLEPCG